MDERIRKGIGWMIGIATGIAVTYAAGLAFIFIGLVIGAMSVCTEPSAWWAPGYDLLALLLPVLGARAGFCAGHTFIRRAAMRR